MQTVAIIGMGQIGGSLGKALRAQSPRGKTLKNKYYIIGIDKDKKTLKNALKIGAADKVSGSFSAAKNSDIAVICLPVDLIIPTYEKLIEILNKKTVVTDSGSVKAAFAPLAAKAKKARYKDLPEFVGAHPMAGKERNGIISADAQMFRGANLIITESSSAAAERKVVKMWKEAGAKIIKMDSFKHDVFAAFTSHLPHIIAFSLNKIYKETRKKDHNADKLTAGSFKSMTRVAVSSADMWAPIFKMNAVNLRKCLKAFIKELQVFEKALDDRDKLKKEILKTQK